MTTIITSPGPDPAVLAAQILGTSSDDSKPSYTFSFTPFLLKTYRHGILPTRPTCKAFMQGLCPQGNSCPDRHITPKRRGFYSNPNTGRFSDENNDMGGSLVCKHWLRGLCKKGDGCEFLHEYNLRKMPECTTFSRTGYCSNGEECLYLHIDAHTKTSLLPCPYYARGFCPLGPSCSYSHRRKTLCPFYLAGFCPQGITQPAPPLPSNLPSELSTIAKPNGGGGKVFEGFGGCEYGTHAKWIEDKDLLPLRRRVIRSKEEIEEEREKRREEAEERENGDGGGTGGGVFRGRGGHYPGGFRGRGGRGNFEDRGGFRGRGRARY